MIARLNHRYLTVLGILLYAPILSVSSHIVAEGEGTERKTLVVRQATNEVVIDQQAEPRSIVLIFAESLETAYSNGEIFGQDLTPGLSSIADEGVNFSNIRQVSHTGWTMGGLVAAQCAIPMSSSMGGNTILANVSLPLPEEVCLGDILKAHGFKTVFIGGAWLSFAGKGKFLRAHGFDKFLVEKPCSNSRAIQPISQVGGSMTTSSSNLRGRN